jgi:hypothetical protein
LVLAELQVQMVLILFLAQSHQMVVGTAVSTFPTQVDQVVARVFSLTLALLQVALETHPQHLHRRETMAALQLIALVVLSTVQVAVVLARLV